MFLTEVECGLPVGFWSGFGGGLDANYKGVLQGGCRGERWVILAIRDWEIWGEWLLVRGCVKWYWHGAGGCFRAGFGSGFGVGVGLVSGGFWGP